MQLLNFTPSTFSLDIDGTPTLVFQTKWQGHADELCRDWVKLNWDQLVSKDRYGNDVPPILKVRMARSTEKLAYEAGAESAEPFRDVKLVSLVAATEQQDKTQDSGEPINDPEHKPGNDDPQAA